MNESVQIAIISASLAALINCVFQIVNKLIDNEKERRDNSDKKKDLYIEKKERVYVAAIGRLLQIRRGFDCTSEEVIRSNKIRDNIEKENIAFAEISPQLRLYASDKIFNIYQELARYSRFAYAPIEGRRLFEESKGAYDMQVTILARMMQEDLGYRKYNNEHDMIICPVCRCEHDIISVCPKCGMTYKELQVKVQEIIKQNEMEEVH